MAEKTVYTKDWLIKEIAYRARFTQSDIRIIWETFEQIVKDIIYDKNELKIIGLFKLYVTTIKAHKGWSPNKKEEVEIPESKRIVFKASRSLLDLFEEKE